MVTPLTSQEPNTLKDYRYKRKVHYSNTHSLEAMHIGVLLMMACLWLPRSQAATIYAVLNGDNIMAIQAACIETNRRHHAHGHLVPVEYLTQAKQQTTEVGHETADAEQETIDAEQETRDVWQETKASDANDTAEQRLTHRPSCAPSSQLISLCPDGQDMKPHGHAQRKEQMSPPWIALIRRRSLNSSLMLPIFNCYDAGARAVIVGCGYDDEGESSTDDSTNDDIDQSTDDSTDKHNQSNDSAATPTKRFNKWAINLNVCPRYPDVMPTKTSPIDKSTDHSTINQAMQHSLSPDEMVVLSTLNIPVLLISLSDYHRLHSACLSNHARLQSIINDHQTKDRTHSASQSQKTSDSSRFSPYDSLWSVPSLLVEMIIDSVNANSRSDGKKDHSLNGACYSYAEECNSDGYDDDVDWIVPCVVTVVMVFFFVSMTAILLVFMAHGRHSSSALAFEQSAGGWPSMVGSVGAPGLLMTGRFGFQQQQQQQRMMMTRASQDDLDALEMYYYEEVAEKSTESDDTEQWQESISDEPKESCKEMDLWDARNENDMRDASDENDLWNASNQNELFETPVMSFALEHTSKSNIKNTKATFELRNRFTPLATDSETSTTIMLDEPSDSSNTGPENNHQSISKCTVCTICLDSFVSGDAVRYSTGTK